LNSLKKISSFLLLTLLAAPLIIFLCFVVQQKILQHRMIEKIEHSPLQSISLHYSDSIWIKKNKEVLVNGKLFDVKSYTFVNDNIILVGLYDNEEDALKDEYRILLQAKKNKSILLDELILKLIFTYAIIENKPTKNLLANSHIKNIFYRFSQNSINQYLSVNTPPPNT
jgi:hypothetical protein